MNQVIDEIFRVLTAALPNVRLSVFVIALFPLVETRLAVPFALKSGLSPFSAWLYSFLGSSAIVPILLFILLPLINLVSRLPFFKKTGNYVLDKFAQKAQKIEGKGKKVYAGLFFFSALPLPLTGVWTASALAAILNLSYKNSLFAIILGNLVSSIILTVLCVFLEEYINIIILAITLIALLAIIAIFVKSLLRKKPAPKVKP